MTWADDVRNRMARGWNLAIALLVAAALLVQLGSRFASVPPRRVTPSAR